MELMLIWNRCGRNTTIGLLKAVNSDFEIFLIGFLEIKRINDIKSCAAPHQFQIRKLTR